MVSLIDLPWLKQLMGGNGLARVCQADEAISSENFALVRMWATGMVTLVAFRVASEIAPVERLSDDGSRLRIVGFSKQHCRIVVLEGRIPVVELRRFVGEQVAFSYRYVRADRQKAVSWRKFRSSHDES